MKCRLVKMINLLLIICSFILNADCVSVDTKMREDADLSEFYHLLEDNQVANNTLMYRHVTVFAPTNRAFQEYVPQNKDALVLYHMSNLPKTTDELGDTISSELEGNPPLWVTRKRGHPQDEIYINNAKILEGSNFRSKINTPIGEKTQVLHKISEVLEPVLSNSPDSLISNPNAFQFLNQSDSINLGQFRIRTFRQRVLLNNKEDIFKADGGYTFFIPDEEGFKPSVRPTKIDHQVIDGHVIPNHVLFTAPTPNDRPYNTLANTDNFKVTISFIRDPDNSKKIYVKSNTLVGDATHPTGVVLAEIVKANIPVKNGVVHLIQRPLMVVDTTVQQFLADKEDGPVYKFYQAIRDYGDDFMDIITRLQDITLFAPSNAAWDEEGVKHILQDKKRFKDILNLHYVREKLPLDKIKQKSLNQVPTAASWKSLYFNVAEGSNGSQMVTVEGGGVNATVITANIAATNGIIHIIDRVLGIPYTTVLDKLRTDPMLNSTYMLGQQRGFNDRLSEPRKRYTYFVPRDSAWEKAKNIYPSAYKKIFMKEFNYHTKQILERHLVEASQAYTMADLKKLTGNESVMLSPIRDQLKLRVREYDGNDQKYDENAIHLPSNNNYGYQIEWMGKWIRVFRPDVACTNGIIHVIDDVLLMPEDVTVSGASLLTITPHILTIIIAKWFL
ncbi:fasciclin-1 isoform X2 [Microplitis mediator]|uniref:fasciclin-1 isoform X2 n=1 Tax=Microplitis mediator TaxID=375433 RepID=UPI0025535922|nr:fasciclin-1 isoform X2 [Microplitis mediator]